MSTLTTENIAQQVYIGDDTPTLPITPSPSFSNLVDRDLQKEVRLTTGTFPRRARPRWQALKRICREAGVKEKVFGIKIPPISSRIHNFTYESGFRVPDAAHTTARVYLPVDQRKTVHFYVVHEDPTTSVHTEVPTNINDDSSEWDSVCYSHLGRVKIWDNGKVDDTKEESLVFGTPESDIKKTQALAHDDTKESLASAATRDSALSGVFVAHENGEAASTAETFEAPHQLRRRRAISDMRAIFLDHDKDVGPHVHAESAEQQP